MKGNDMANPWYWSWADMANKPSSKSIESWTLSRWLSRKALDTQQALFDINHTLSINGGKDEAVSKAHMIESFTLEHLTGSFPVDIPLMADYIPKVINRVWIEARVAELERQRVQFATMAYWKSPRPPKDQANKCLHIINRAFGAYQQLSASDWRGVIDALQEYVVSLEETQLIMVIARSMHLETTWPGPVARLAKKIRADLKGIHKTLVMETMVTYPGLIVHPWMIDEGMDLMTWEQYQATPLAYWEPEMAGPPRLTDGPLYDRVLHLGLEDLIDERRAKLDEMNIALRGARFGLAKGFIRRESKVWGRARTSVAQYKRWMVWPGSVPMPATDDVILDDDEVL